jgi:hypothetical protein
MNLDAEITLPDEYDLCPDRDDQILPTLDDAMALLPGWAQRLDSPVRDALLEAWRAMANMLQAKLGQFIAQTYSPRTAEDTWLAEFGSLLHQPKTGNESEGEYRARLLARGDVVSPVAIKAAVDALVAKASPIAPVYLEPATDAIFWAALDSPWSAFWQPTSHRLWADYPDNINPTVGAYWSPDVEYALFWVILPGDTGAGEPQVYCQPSGDEGAVGTQWIDLFSGPSFVMPVNSEVGFVFANDTPLLEQITSTVNPIRGGGVTWAIYTDFGIASAL